jgi:DNA primase
MTAYISQEKIDEIRDRADIVQVVADHLVLRKRGRNHVGLCPFHSEKTPSLTVSEEKQIFHCFGCGKGGNVFTFLMEFNNLSFPEVLKSLAQRVGVALPQYEEKKVITKEERLLKDIYFTNQLAMEFYHNQLLSEPSVQFVRQYLKERGIQRETIKVFKLGYGERRGQGLLTYLKRKNVSLELAERAGLVISKDSGRSYFDRFRGRLMFPILDVRKRVVGFGGRVLGEAMPKYLNSPETAVFKKSETLYGLNITKEFIRKKEAVLVAEGYFDLLALYQSGISNVVATLGTALTARHINVLKRYTQSFYTVFDSDVAGKKAAMRSLPLFLEEEVSPRIVVLSGGKDPAQVIRENGKEKMLEAIKKSTPLLDFYIQEKAREFNLRDSQGKVSFVEEVLPLFRLIKDPLKRGVCVKSLSEFAGIGEEFIVSRIRKISSTRRGKQSQGKETVVTIQSFLKAQENLLKIFMINPELFRDEYIGIFNNFSDDSLKVIGTLWESRFDKGERLTLAALMDHIDDNQLKSRLSELLVDDGTLESEDLNVVLRDCLKTIKLHTLEVEKKDLMHLIKEAEDKRENDTLKVLLKKKQDLIQFEKSLKVLS